MHVLPLVFTSSISILVFTVVFVGLLLVILTSSIKILVFTLVFTRNLFPN